MRTTNLRIDSCFIPGLFLKGLMQDQISHRTNAATDDRELARLSSAELSSAMSAAIMQKQIM
jgi:hypothetical protein